MKPLERRLRQTGGKLYQTLPGGGVLQRSLVFEVIEFLGIGEE